MNRKAQEDRPLIYALAAVAIFVILAVGYGSSKRIIEFNKEKGIANFGITLENNLKTYSTAPYSYGTVNEKAFSLPDGVKSVCFVDRNNELNKFVDNELSLWANNFPDENVFFKPFNEFMPVNAKYLSLDEKNNPLCVNAANNKISLSFVTRGSASEITALNESKDIDCISLVYNGREENRVDIVFLGYAYKELADFSDDVNDYIDLFLKTEPFMKNKHRLNFYRVDKFPDLKCEIKGWIKCDDFAVKKLASECPNDYIFVLADRSKIADFARPVRSAAVGRVADINTAEMKTVLLHEFGHTFGGLADEYVDKDYYGSIDFDGKLYPNCDVTPCLKWNLVTKGCYEGCSLEAYNRPTKTSIMRTLREDYFGLVNEYAIERVLEQYK